MASVSYTHLTHVTSISRALNPYTQYEEYIALAESPDLRVLVSNTTEAGIEYLGTEKLLSLIHIFL